MNAEIPTLPPPTSIFYTEKHVSYQFIKLKNCFVLFCSIFNSVPTCTRLGLWLALITPVSPTLLQGLLSGNTAAQHRSDKNSLYVMTCVKYSWKGHLRNSITYLGWIDYFCENVGAWEERRYQRKSWNGNYWILWSRQGVCNSSMLEYQNIFQFNKAEFIGRTFAKPHVFLEEDLVFEKQFYNLQTF